MHEIGLRSLAILLAFSLIAACGDDDDGESGDGSDGGSTTSDGDGGGTTGDGDSGSDGGGTGSDGGTDDGGTATDTGTGGDGTGTGSGTGTGGNDCPPEAEDGECLACLRENCCEGLLHCLDDADCACVVECMDGGGAGTGTATGTGTGTGGVNCPALCNGGGNPWGGFSYCVGGFCDEQCPGA